MFLKILNLMAKKEDNNLDRLKILAGAIKKSNTKVILPKCKPSAHNISNILKRPPLITKVDTNYLIKKNQNI